MEINDLIVFETTLKNGKPSLVKFSADWCVACTNLLPTWEQSKSTYGNAVNYIEVDAEEGADITNKLKIRGLPTVIGYCSQGTIVRTVTGSNINLLDMVDTINGYNK